MGIFDRVGNRAFSPLNGPVSSGGGGTGADTALSNLASTAISADLIFGAGVAGNISTADGGGSSQSIHLFTGNGNSGSNSGSVRIETGSANGFGSPTSGDILLVPGAVAASRGKIKFQDGSEGTAGYVWTSTDAQGSGHWAVAGGGGGGVSAMTAIGSSPNSNGATISGSTLTLQPASASFGGVITAGTQTMAGDKTFTGVFSASSTIKLGPGVVDLYGGGTTNESPVTMFGTPPSVDPNRGMFTIADTTPLAIGVGGSIAFAGKYFASSPPTFFATIQGANEDGVSNETNGYLSFKTRSSSLGITEFLRIGSLGAVRMAKYATGFAKFDASGNISSVNGASGSFTTVDSKTVTVVNGLITSIV